MASAAIMTGSLISRMTASTSVRFSGTEWVEHVGKWGTGAGGGGDDGHGLEVSLRGWNDTHVICATGAASIGQIGGVGEGQG